MAFTYRRSPSTLLLLPPPPSFTFGPVEDAFSLPLAEVYARLVRILDGSNRLASLDIALAIPDLLAPANRPRAKVFEQLQRYLTSIYTLVGAVCSAKNIELDAPGGIDTRVIFVDHTPSEIDCPEFGPVLALKSLATSERSWDYVFYPDIPAGQNLASTFANLAEPSNKNYMYKKMHAINSNTRWTLPPSLLVPDSQQASKPHHSVAVGGTFDHLHLGHKLLLTATALALEPPGEADPNSIRSLTIGVTGPALLVNKKYAEFLESYNERYESTARFLIAIMNFRSTEESNAWIQQVCVPGYEGRQVEMTGQPHLSFKFEEISDPFGPTITDENISALVVSRETHAGGAAVNEERAKKGWKSLEIFEVDVLQAGEAASPDDFESKLSSTEIRRRRMNLAKV
ncbi:hypothetical protein N7474_008325 [Penicillium riverlandense]|uniref:uncharacterized protein n=1 Tax=Penicillium riverlandense TaxID=1903569 RepID=UPI0025474F3F|nr:uncharacterized protein N7474_008325 [Penicillium riverlandense]KAJ5812024.1 hypothetical protein N7474_008325 [Penicillium riverlandense]